MERELDSGLIHLHVLLHAAREPIFGVACIEELGRHGYTLKTGTIYPILYNLEKKGYLQSAEECDGNLTRRVYRATPKGKKALEDAKEKVRALFVRLFESKATELGASARASLRRARRS